MAAKAVKDGKRGSRHAWAVAGALARAGAAVSLSRLFGGRGWAVRASWGPFAVGCTVPPGGGVRAVTVGGHPFFRAPRGARPTLARACAMARAQHAALLSRQEAGRG